MNSPGRINWVLIGGVFMVIMAVFVFADAPVWDVYGNTTYSNEDTSPVFSYNFSANASDPENGSLTFYFSQDSPIIWSGNSSMSKDDFYWIF